MDLFIIGSCHITHDKKKPRFQTSMTHWADVELMLGHRLRYCRYIKSTSGQRIMFAGLCLGCFHVYKMFMNNSIIEAHNI